MEGVSEHLCTYGLVEDYPDPEHFLDLLLHSEAHDFRYADPLYDNLLERARAVSNRERRLNL